MIIPQIFQDFVKAVNAENYEQVQNLCANTVHIKNLGVESDASNSAYVTEFIRKLHQAGSLSKVLIDTDSTTEGSVTIVFSGSSGAMGTPTSRRVRLEFEMQDGTPKIKKISAEKMIPAPALTGE